MKKYIIAYSNSLYDQLFSGLSENFIIINNKGDLNLSEIQKINPEYIFFPHWSYKITPEIYENFACVIFHMTDLPFGRGGSPLQNLIAREVYQTKISAIKCTKEIDAGPVYLKEDLALNGSAKEIYLRSAKIILKMIDKIVQENPQPKEQEGEVVIFKRRAKEDGDLKDLSSLQKIYDYIRMLDAEGYPNAFLRGDGVRFEFSEAEFDGEKIVAKVIIRKEE